MGLIDLIRLAGQNLWRRKARTMLTILGVIIGTICIVLMVALGISNYAQFEENFLNSASLTEIEVYANGGRMNQNAKITDNTIASFAVFEGVDMVTPVLRMPTYIVAGNYEANHLSVMAVDPEYIKDDFEFEDGGMFAGSAMPQIVVGYYAQNNFTEQDAEPEYAMHYDEEEQDISLPFDFQEQKLKLYLGGKYYFENEQDDVPKSRRYNAAITGVLKKAQNEQAYNAYMSLSTAKTMVQQNRKLAENMGLEIGSYENARIRAVDIDSVSGIIEKLNEMGFEAYSQGSVLEEIQKEQTRQQSQLIMIGLIALFVSAIGIANTMLTSIMERKREIGIMKVTGLALSKIRRMFLIEAAVIGLSGGAIGALVSYIISFFANNSAGETVILGMYFGEGMQLIIPFWLTLVGIGIAVLIGVVAGIYPAWKATKMSPMEVIRGR